MQAAVLAATFLRTDTNDFIRTCCGCTRAAAAQPRLARDAGRFRAADVSVSVLSTQRARPRVADHERHVVRSCRGRDFWGSYGMGGSEEVLPCLTDRRSTENA